MKMQPSIVGAVAYDAKVIPIWEGIREYYRGAPVEMDVVWFSNYEAQVEALLAASSRSHGTRTSRTLGRITRPRERAGARDAGYRRGVHDAPRQQGRRADGPARPEGADARDRER